MHMKNADCGVAHLSSLYKKDNWMLSTLPSSPLLDDRIRRPRQRNATLSLLARLTWYYAKAAVGRRKGGFVNILQWLPPGRRRRRRRWSRCNMGQMASLACRVLLLLLSPPAWLVSGNDLSLVYDLCSPLSSFFLHRRLPVLIWRRGKRGDGEKSSMKGK